MSDTRRVIRVFLGSPGDLAEERRAAKAAVDFCNELMGDEFGCHVELLGWEDTTPGFGRPQAIINRDLDRCELFIGVLWKRWGTPPDREGSYSSGFDEEFQRSISRRKAEGRPEIFVFFKRVDEDQLRDPGEQLKKVIDFREQLIAGKEILFKDFASTSDFERDLLKHLVQYARGELSSNINELGDQRVSPRENTDLNLAQASDSPQLEPQLLSFFENFCGALRSGGIDGPSPIDVARLRLFGSIASNPANDSTQLGVHDANLLFKFGNDLSVAENYGLLSTGLAHLRDENVPLWRWVNSILPKSSVMLTFASIGADLAVRPGALAAMRLLGVCVPAGFPANADACASIWFENASPAQVRIAALEYFAELGTVSDLQFVRAEFERGDSATVATAASAAVAIRLRESVEDALIQLYELRPSTINRSLVTKVFARPDVIGDDLIVAGLKHPNDRVRQFTSAIALRRGLLCKEVAESLLKDSDSDVRLCGLMALTDLGVKVSRDVAYRTLIQDSKTSSLLQVAGPRAYANYDSFRKFQVARLSNEELEARVSAEGIYGAFAAAELARRHFPSMGDQLRRDVDDRYHGHFELALRKLRELFGDESSEVTGALEQKDHIRKQFMRSALDVLCSRSDPRDLARVRENLREGDVEYSPLDLEYLGKHGEWCDIQIVLSSLKRVGLLGGLLISVDDDRYELAARTIYRLGRARPGDLLAIDMPSRVFVLVALSITDEAFGSVDDDLIVSLLSKQSEFARKVIALKCVRVFSKHRATLLLKRLVGQETYFYNAIFWLDALVSLPVSLARQVAKRELADLAQE